MPKYLIKAIIDGKEVEEILWASSEKEAVVMFTSSVKWKDNKAEIKIVSINLKDEIIKRLRGC